MNIILINPPNIPFSEQKIINRTNRHNNFRNIFTKKQNHNVKFLDMDCKKLDCNDLIKYIKNDFNPEVAIISYDYHIPLHTIKKH